MLDDATFMPKKLFSRLARLYNEGLEYDEPSKINKETYLFKFFSRRLWLAFFRSSLLFLSFLCVYTDFYSNNFFDLGISIFIVSFVM